MRGNAYVTGPPASRHGSEREREQPAGPALTGSPPSMGRKRGGRRVLGPPWGASPRPENDATFATSCLHVTGDASFPLALLQRGQGPFNLPQQEGCPPTLLERGSRGPGGSKAMHQDRPARCGATRPASPHWAPRPAPVRPPPDEVLGEFSGTGTGRQVVPPRRQLQPQSPPPAPSCMGCVLL